MTVLPVSAGSESRSIATWSWLRSLPETASGSAARAVLLLDRVLALVVLALMVVAGLVIAVVTLGVLLGFIA